VLLQHLKYLVTLAQERHFARAAKACHVTQPTLSEGIKHLEELLGVPIAERNQRFQRLTPAGERVLLWAQRMLADYATLAQEIAELREGLVGQLTLAAIPAAQTIVPLLTTPLVDAHPKIRVQVLSQTSREIQQSLDDFSVDLGVTYLDSEPLSRVTTHALYRERYILVTPGDGPLRGHAQATWAQAAKLRLCLLSDAMQNRRILNAIFQKLNLNPVPPVETLSLLTALAHVRLGGWSTILPHTFHPLVAALPNVAVLSLVEPVVEHTIGLAIPKRDPLPPLSRALLSLARQLDVNAALVGLGAECASFPAPPPARRPKG
jgi:DNA-binding transcriptional LysR family regulator